MDDIDHNMSEGMMASIDIQLSYHAKTRMERKRISMEDIALTLELGEHTDGRRPGTREAYLELDGRPVTVVYDLTRYEMQDLFHVITVIRRSNQ